MWLVEMYESNSSRKLVFEACSLHACAAGSRSEGGCQVGPALCANSVQCCEKNVEVKLNVNTLIELMNTIIIEL